MSTVNLGGSRGKYLNRHMDNVLVLLSVKLFVLMSKYFFFRNSSEILFLNIFPGVANVKYFNLRKYITYLPHSPSETCFISPPLLQDAIPRKQLLE